jgi:hypothetical protein
LCNYKLDGFSVERLMTLLNALDQDIEIVIREKPRSRGCAAARGLDKARRHWPNSELTPVAGHARSLPRTGGW